MKSDTVSKQRARAKAPVNYDEWWESYSEGNRLDPGSLLRKKIISQVLAMSPFHTLIDLGCGNGQLLEYIHTKFPDAALYGTDVAETALKTLQKKHITKASYVINLEKPKKINKTFDVIICSEVVEHLQHWRPAIDFINSLAKKNTLVIITTQSGKRYPHHLAIGHIKHFEPSELATALRRHNFTIVSAKKFGWPFMSLKNEFITVFMHGDTSENPSLVSKIGMRLFYYLYHISPIPYGPQIVVIARKN